MKKNGREIGITEGQKIEKKKIAKLMKQNNCPIDDIVKYTKLTKEEVEKL